MPSQIVIKPSDTLKTNPVFSMFDGFNAHHAHLNGAPGKRISGIERVRDGRRVRYERGVIYERRDRYVWVHGDIRKRYEQLGESSSWLGLPLSEELDMPEGGKATVFDRGTIYWWPDVGATELNEVIIQYTGIVCFGETDTDGFLSNSDEPYVVLGMTAPSGALELRTQIYDDVDGGESRFDVIELYRGQPQGVVLTTLLVEHDEGDPDKYRAIVGQAVDKAMDKLTPVIANALGGVPAVGPALAFAASQGLPLLVPAIADGLNKLLGTDDEVLGHPTIQLTAKQMVLLAASKTTRDEHGIPFKVAMPLISSQGASYGIYFNVVPA